MQLSLSKILVPVDLSDHSNEALRFAGGLAGRLHARLDVLHVAGPLAYVDVADPYQPASTWRSAFVQSDPGRLLDAMLRELQEGGVDADWQLEVGDPAAMILKVAAEGGHDLIIMGRHGHGRLRHLLMGSVAERVTRKANVPVLAIREDRDRAGRGNDLSPFAAPSFGLEGRAR